MTRFQHCTNNGSEENTVLLTGLKNIFQKQLPNMPREYIAKVVYDRSHNSMILISDDESVIGGICYKPFQHRRFVEIVFAAVKSSEQVKGYGSAIMNNLKHAVSNLGDYRYLITYADNYAIGYFKKQGFTQDFGVLDEKTWKGYIKDYEGANPMVCVILPKVNYLTIKEDIELQKSTINDIISQHTSQKTRYKGLDFRKGPIDPMSIPGVKESGWTPELAEKHSIVAKSANLNLFTQLLDDLRNHHSAWPFAEPVDGEQVKDYYTLITNPMDLRKLAEKVTNNEYVSLEAFKRDVQLIFDNCRIYNAPNTPYYKSADSLEKFFQSKLLLREKHNAPSNVNTPTK
eukprot:NODE_225_length_12315_cov_1.300671.p2 type:complete len:344 gc:universal NODE_225_length_12315_cov_1.300671:11477-10446(-)